MAISLRICRENDIDSAAISASSAIGSLPASNVKDEDIKKIWRSTGSPAYLIADIGSTLTLGYAASMGSNLRSTDTFRVRASLTDNTVTSSLTYDSGTLSGFDAVFGQMIHFIEPAVSYRYLRIDMTQSDTPEVGRLASGEAWIPSRHMSLVSPPESLWRDLSRRSVSLGGNVFTDIRPRQRGYRFTLRNLTDAEKTAEIDELNRLRGIGREILLCIDKDSSNIGRDTIWGLLEQPARATRMSGMQNAWEVEVEVWERI